MMLHIEFSMFLTTPFNFASTTPPPTPSLLLCKWEFLQVLKTTLAWVWEVNRGNRVGENATLTFGTDSNLVYRHGWPSGMANQHWKQRCGRPQAASNWKHGPLQLNDQEQLYLAKLWLPNRRASVKENYNGAYSLILGPKGLVMHYKSKNSPKPLPYLNMRSDITESWDHMTLNCTPDTYEGHAYDINLDPGQAIFLCYKIPSG